VVIKWQFSMFLQKDQGIILYFVAYSVMATQLSSIIPLC